MYLNVPAGDGSEAFSVRLPAHAQNNRLWMTWLRREGGLNGWSLTNTATADQMGFNEWYDADMRQKARQFRAEEQDRRRNMPGSPGIGRSPTMAENRAEFGRQLRQTHPHMSPHHFAFASVAPPQAWGGMPGGGGAPPALLRPDAYHSMHQRLGTPAPGMQFRV